jgi:Ni/Co efflux regulator RcnB
MNTIRISTAALAACISFALASPALADSDKGKGHGKGKEHKESRDHDGDRRGDKHADRHEARFENRDKTLVRNYYAAEERRGFCPPGLAKKHNGCMPPGQAKQWQVGQPLPRDVKFYEVPQPLVTQLGTPPAGYQYIRVASDILLMAMGDKANPTVVDAIRNFGRI